VLPRFVLSIVISAIATGVPAAARAAACTSAPYHQFDFFVGHWDVYDAAGKFQGTDLVEKRINGCAIYEQYTNPDGSVGIGLSAYQAEPKTWHQDFMSQSGLVVSLDGRPSIRAAMVLSGEDYPADGSRRLDKGVWLVKSGVVEETWTVSTDGGKTWKTLFDGFFHRKKE
jgi:hypothetical protein